MQINTHEHAALNHLLISVHYLLVRNEGDVWRRPAPPDVDGILDFFLHYSFNLPGKSVNDILRFIVVSLASVHCCILPPTN